MSTPFCFGQLRPVTKSDLVASASPRPRRPDSLEDSKCSKDCSYQADRNQKAEGEGVPVVFFVFIFDGLQQFSQQAIR